jgi:dephospho-CoA kinase
MSFEESWPYDFRVESLLKVIDRLEEYTAALNLPPSAYSRRASTTAPAQLSLLQTRREILVIVGRTCAGKTTMAERLSAEHGYTYFEASSILRTFQDPNPENADGSNMAGDQGFAERILNRFGPDAVARRLLELIEGTHIERLAVSGFRTIEELECIRAHFPEARVVLVYASDRTRYERRIKRARADEGLTFEQFNRLDESQWSFGLLRVAEELADIRIVNEGTLEEFYSKIGSVVSGDFSAPVAGVSQMLRPRHWSATNQLVRCLEVLSAAARPLDCAEIEEGTSNAGFKVRHNNANKVLKAAGELARRIEMPNCRVRYRISDAGRAYLRLLHQRESAEGSTGAERQLRDDQ